MAEYINGRSPLEGSIEEMEILLQQVRKRQIADWTELDTERALKSLRCIERRYDGVIIHGLTYVRQYSEVAWRNDPLACLRNATEDYEWITMKAIAVKKELLIELERRVYGVKNKQSVSSRGGGLSPPWWQDSEAIATPTRPSKKL